MTDDLTSPLGRLLFIRSRALLRGKAVGSGVLAELLTRMEMPDSLLGAKRIASQACGLLREGVSALLPEERSKVAEYIRELRWVISHADELAFLLFFTQHEYQSESEQEHRSEQERRSFLCCSGGNPYSQGGAREHGLCCLLWEQYIRQGPNIDKLPSLQKPYDALRRQALLIHITALGYWTQREDWLSPGGPAEILRPSMYRKTLAIRHFTMDRYRGSAGYRNVLRHIPTVASKENIRPVMRTIRVSLPASASVMETRLHEDIGSILALLRIADNPDSLHSYTRAAEIEINGEDLNVLRDPPPGPEEVKYEVECEGEEANESGGSTKDGDNNNNDEDRRSPGVTYTRHDWSEEDKKNCLEAGIHPADALPIQHLHLSINRYGDSSDWQAMLNQNLSLSWRNLALQEVAVALQLLATQSEQGLEELEIFVLATIVVARGLTLPLAQSIHVRCDRPDEVDTLTLFLPAGNKEQAEWLLPAVPIPYQQEQGTYYGCRQIVRSFILPDYWHIGSLLRRLIAVKFPLWDGGLLHPFEAPAQFEEHLGTYALRLGNALRTADPNRGPGLADRVTFPCLGRVLPERIRKQTAGNLVLMTYATLQNDRTGEDGRFYASPAVQSVQQADLAATSSIVEELHVIGYDASTDLSLKPSSSTGYLGSPMCPTLDALQMFFAGLLAKIAAANDRLDVHGDMEAFIARHNLFTMLTYCAVSLGTCHRPTLGAVPKLDEIDTSSGLVSIVDKGTKRARLGVAAEASVAQLTAYADYIRESGLDKLLGSRSDRSLFFISPEMEFVDVSPATLKQQGLPFVANFARHLVKTILSEWCDSGEVRVLQEWVSAILGHFMEGEEPAGSHSTFDYKSFAKSMRAALGHLLASIQFEPINVKGERINVHAS